MTMRWLALAGMTTLLMTFSAAAEVAPPAHFGSPLSAQPAAQQAPARDYRYYQCFTDDGYGRHVPCDGLFKQKRGK